MERYRIGVTKPDGTSEILSNGFDSKESADIFVEFSNKIWQGLYIYKVIDTNNF